MLLEGSYGIGPQRDIGSGGKLNIAHILLPLSANLDRHLFQLDAKNLFLNEDLA